MTTRVYTTSKIFLNFFTLYITFPVSELVPPREPKYEIILEEEEEQHKEEEEEQEEELVEKRLSKKERKKKKRFR